MFLQLRSWVNVPNPQHVHTLKHVQECAGTSYTHIYVDASECPFYFESLLRIVSSFMLEIKLSFFDLNMKFCLPRGL